MDDRTEIEQGPAYVGHSAEVALMVTDQAGFKAKASMTTGGLLAVAVLVSSILLSTSVLVFAASRARRRRN